MNYKSLVAALGAFAVVAPVRAAPPPVDEATLTRELSAAVDRRDDQALDRYYCPGAILVGPGNFVRSADQARHAARMNTTPVATLLVRRWEEMKIRRAGATTIVTADTMVEGRYGKAESFVGAVWTLGPGGQPCLVYMQRTPDGVAAEASRWDEAFQVSTAINREPNRLLVDAVRAIKPGRALDVGMGQGRNAIYLASAGWDVTGFDVSSEGLRLARADAKARGVKINTVYSADTDFDFGHRDWDLIAFLYVGTREFVDRAFAGLKPGGLVVAEAFGNASDPSRAGDPVTWAPGEMRKLFERVGFQIVQYAEPTDIADYGRAKVPLVRLVARKPAR